MLEQGLLWLIYRFKARTIGLCHCNFPNFLNYLNIKFLFYIKYLNYLSNFVRTVIWKFSIHYTTSFVQSYWILVYMVYVPAEIYLFKDNSGNTRTMWIPI